MEGSNVFVQDPESGRQIGAWITRVGKDLVVAVGGGQKPHVGCVVLAEPRPAKEGGGAWSASCSVHTIPPHKEEPIARGVATRLAETFGRVSVVTAGVHDDNLDADGIADYLSLGEKLTAEIVRRLTEDGLSSASKSHRRPR